MLCPGFPTDTYVLLIPRSGLVQIAFVDTETGELQERRLQHREEAEKFYRDLAAQGMKVRVGMEASGHARWFERLLAELQLELWIGDATVIRAKRGRKPKTDRQDAQHILKLMLKDDFPKIWVPNWENRWRGLPSRVALLWLPVGRPSNHKPGEERGCSSIKRCSSSVFCCVASTNGGAR